MATPRPPRSDSGWPVRADGSTTAIWRGSWPSFPACWPSRTRQPGAVVIQWRTQMASCYDLATETLNKIGRYGANRITADRATARAGLSGSPIAIAAARSLGIVLRHEERQQIADRVTLEAAGRLEATGLTQPAHSGMVRIRARSVGPCDSAAICRAHSASVSGRWNVNTRLLRASGS